MLIYHFSRSLIERKDGNYIMQNKNVEKITRLDEVHAAVYIILAVFVLALNTVLCVFVPKVHPLVWGGILLIVYGVASAAIYMVAHKRIKLFRQQSNASEEQSQSVIYAFRNQIKLPYAVVKENGKIVTANAAFSTALGTSSKLFNMDINSLCGINLAELINIADKKITFTDEPETYEETYLKNVSRAETAVLGAHKFRIECYPLASKGKTYYMLVFHDITELSSVTELYKNKRTAIGYIVIDNLEEIAQYVKVNYQEETRSVGKLLDDWASRMGGMLCEYESNKFLLLFTQEMLNECVKNKFEILSEVQKIEIGDAHIPLTVSMGIATTGETLEEREHDAMVSLDMALQRGGDQVVLKNATGIFYFGAKTKTLQKRTRGHGKIIYAKLANLIENASNVLIMGHKSPDFDCIGACIGVSTLIKNMFKSKDVKIVTDTQCANFLACTGRLMALSEYQNMFIDGVSALEYNSSETLLIIVDTNNLAIVESPELAKNAFKIAIIDHHIKKEEYAEEPELSYIDPSASSACELIAEMLEEILPPDISFKEEANVMISGIMLDTKNFTRTVGMRTFAAALYLKNAGADTEYARTFFEENFEDYLSESQFGSNARIYRGCIAIASADDLDSANSRVLAAKASDKLLAIKNVNAAFALISINGTVNISARSDGSINVQLIAERLGGGGHFDMAGAAIADATLEDAEKRLIAAIDDYYASLTSKSNKN